MEVPDVNHGLLVRLPFARIRPEAYERLILDDAAREPSSSR